jgi:hypothetical protein
LKAAQREFTGCHPAQIGGANGRAFFRELQKPWQLNGPILRVAQIAR